MRLKYKNHSILFYIYTLFIILLVILPINGSNPDSPLNNIYIVSIRLDYLLHCAIFIPWVFLLWKKSGAIFWKNKGNIIFYLLVGILFATAAEAIQYVLPYRAFNINDLLANGLGVVMGFLIVLTFERAGIPFRGLRSAKEN